VDLLQRRIGGWGFEGERYPPSPELLAWLAERLGETTPLRGIDPSAVSVPPPQRLPALAVPVSQDPQDRLAHSRGQGITDLVRLRTGALPAAPDAVLRPTGDEQVEVILRCCAENGVQVIPWGGGTSVTGGVTTMPTRQPTVVLSLERMSGLVDLDRESGLATFGAGTSGPLLEGALGPHLLTVGHFPQSWELSTLGGWIVTRSSGQESLGYGSIDDLVAGLDLVAPAGRLRIPAQPASAAGPDLRELVLGSEGRLGVVTRATVRVRPQPLVQQVIGTMLPSWDQGLAAAAEVLRVGLPLTLLRLSDAAETEVALTLGMAHRPVLAPLARRWLAWQGVAQGGCLLLSGAAGRVRAVRRALAQVRRLLRRYGGVGLGRSPGRQWLKDRFRHPYLRDALLDLGIATDTLETAAPWSRLAALARAVRQALDSALERDGERVAVLCHASHPYLDGASLYFTVFFRCPADPEAAIARWAIIKRVATEAVVAGGGTLSHHHGVGSWHAPWLEREVGSAGIRLLGAAAATLDPLGILNPHVLLDPIDRLEA
jgi:alkyldihydroxyacetonephosphate synthase